MNGSLEHLNAVAEEFGRRAGLGAIGFDEDDTLSIPVDGGFIINFIHRSESGTVIGFCKLPVAELYPDEAAPVLVAMLEASMPKDGARSFTYSVDPSDESIVVAEYRDAAEITDADAFAAWLGEIADAVKTVVLPLLEPAIDREEDGDSQEPVQDMIEV